LKPKAITAILILSIAGLWISSHFRMFAVGFELPIGAVGVAFERGSLFFVKGERPAEPYKPFFESLEYDGSFIGLPPSFRETLLGTFSLGEHPRLSWLKGITVPLLLVFLVASAAPTLLVLARSSQVGPEEVEE
jgi:hypothetical protein